MSTSQDQLYAQKFRDSCVFWAFDADHGDSLSWDGRRMLPFLIRKLLVIFSSQAAGLLNGFGSIDLDVVPSKTRTMSPDKLMELTGMNVQSLAPGRPTSTWLVAVS